MHHIEKLSKLSYPFLIPNTVDTRDLIPNTVDTRDAFYMSTDFPHYTYTFSLTNMFLKVHRYTYLLWLAEDVGIVLLEPPDSSEPTESTRQLISV